MADVEQAPNGGDGYTPIVGQEPLAPDAQQPPQSPFGGMWMLVVIIGVWVLFLWTSRKNSKKQQKKREEEINSLNKGAKVITIGRLHGTVVSTTDTTFTIRPDPAKDYTLTFDREALLRYEGDKGEEKK
jgi:preprotein translocase subunit YajC